MNSLKLLIGLCVGLTPVVASANDLSLSLPLDGSASVAPTNYTCSDGKKYLVRYVNSGENSLALIEINGKSFIFAGVESASGSRYVSNTYEWWSKRNEAFFTNVLDENSKLTCEETDSAQ